MNDKRQDDVDIFTLANHFEIIIIGPVTCSTYSFFPLYIFLLLKAPNQQIIFTSLPQIELEL